jgi:endonuclease V-like protein UPF0215 family
MDVKDQARLIGFDDGPFTFDDETAALAGVMTRGGRYVEAVFTDHVTVDGTDATRTLIDLIADSGFEETTQAVALNAGTLAGFNVVDLDALHEALDVPVLAVTREKPDPDAVRETLETHVDDPQSRLDLLEAQPVHTIDLDEGPCYVRHAGGDIDELAYLLRVHTVRGRTPEPIRIAHLVATAIAEGRSRGA